MLNVIDLFCGAGGFSSGFKNAGFDIVFANEINPNIALTYKYNHLNTVLAVGDIQ